MSDHIEHKCTRCGSLLHHVDNCPCPVVITPPQTQSELDKAVEIILASRSRGEQHGSHYSYPEWVIDHLLLAAKRLKEVEKDRDETRQKNRDLKWELAEMHEQRQKFEQELSVLRTEYKNALEVLSKYSIAHGGKEKGGRYWTLEDAEAKRESVLFSPHAIAAMKKGEG